MPDCISRKLSIFSPQWVVLNNFQGIYPTLIIVIVALDKSEIEKESLTYLLPTDRSAIVPHHTHISSSDTSVCGDAVCTQSLALIETPTREVGPISGVGCADMEMKRAESTA